jgi:hypothetical protein
VWLRRRGSVAICALACGARANVARSKGDMTGSRVFHRSAPQALLYA